LWHHALTCCAAPACLPAAKERALAEQQEQLLAARTEAERKLDASNSRLRAVAERERELEQRQQQLMQQVEQAQADLQRRQGEAEQRLEEVAARERSLKRQEDGLEGLKVRRTAWTAVSRHSAAVHLIVF
jgi:TolA-binding protein